ncbi:hypothetical protein B4U79_19110, partial [Dinothrombium tinctorium]
MACLESQNFALRCVSQLYLSAHLSDIAIVIDDEKIPCHKTILAATSPFFEKCLFDEKHVGNELILDTSKQSFLPALKFMYTGELEFDNIDEDRLIEFFSLSQSLQIKPLVDMVEHRLNGIEISTKNVELIDPLNFSKFIRPTKLVSDEQYFTAQETKPFGIRHKPEILSTK